MEILSIILVSILSGILTYLISNNLKKGPVFASAIVTLVSGIFLPHFFGEFGTSLMVVAACSSYAGMVAVKNIPNIWEMIIVSTITAMLFILASSSYVGVGGRLGTIAALSCFTWIGFKKFVYTTNLNVKETLKVRSVGIWS